MSAKWNMVIDISLCESCNNCTLSTKDELVGNLFDGYSAPHANSGPGVMRLERHHRGQTPMVDVAHVPRMCNHCDDAPCVRDGKGAVKKRDDGIVIFDPILAKGRRDLLDSCPYDAVIWNEEQQLPQTWFFDAHLLDAGWNEPRCVGVCPTRAMEVFKIEDDVMQGKAMAENLRTLSPDLGLKPRVYYRNLDRADTCFIGGSVTANIRNTIECVADAKVELRHSGQPLAITKTDYFGDFKFDSLMADSGEYEIFVNHSSHGSITVSARLEKSSLVLTELNFPTK